MTRLTRETIRLPTATIGVPNPLPPLAGMLDPPFDLDATGVPEEIRRGIAYGYPDNLMPYLHHDGYDRDRRPGELDVALLENDVLRARITLGLGGRIWSLEHKPSGRDLVYRNRVLQPANFGLRNAWFSGGIEWNIGTRGHSPTSCAPVHAAVVERPDGAPMVRMWQWERLREVSFQVDVWLEGELLLAYVRIRNPNDRTTPMYWWSNVAVAETPGTRVLAPAHTAFRTGYDGRLTRAPVPGDWVDTTYPRNSGGAADFFYALDPGAQPWITALDADGRGLVQTSTARLPGRKLFVWGRSEGSRHWQEWLSGGGDPYLEIQAGLTTTQYEHVPMPPQRRMVVGRVVRTRRGRPEGGARRRLGSGRRCRRHRGAATGTPRAARRGARDRDDARRSAAGGVARGRRRLGGAGAATAYGRRRADSADSRHAVRRRRPDRRAATLPDPAGDRRPARARPVPATARLRRGRRLAATPRRVG